MLDTHKEESSTVVMAVLAILVLVMIVWGWMRVHTTTELNPVNKPPAGKSFGGAPSTS